MDNVELLFIYIDNWIDSNKSCDWFQNLLWYNRNGWWYCDKNIRISSERDQRRQLNFSRSVVLHRVKPLVVRLELAALFTEKIRNTMYDTKEFEK